MSFISIIKTGSFLPVLRSFGYIIRLGLEIVFQLAAKYVDVLLA